MAVSLWMEGDQSKFTMWFCVFHNLKTAEILTKIINLKCINFFKSFWVYFNIIIIPKILSSWCYLDNNNINFQCISFSFRLVNFNCTWLRHSISVILLGRRYVMIFMPQFNYYAEHAHTHLSYWNSWIWNFLMGFVTVFPHHSIWTTRKPSRIFNYAPLRLLLNC